MVNVAPGLALGALVVLLGWLVVRRPLSSIIETLQRGGLRWLLPQGRTA